MGQFILGFFIGAFFGIFTISLCAAAKDEKGDEK